MCVCTCVLSMCAHACMCISCMTVHVCTCMCVLNALKEASWLTMSHRESAETETLAAAVAGDLHPCPLFFGNELKQGEEANAQRHLKSRKHLES